MWDAKSLVEIISINSVRIFFFYSLTWERRATGQKAALATGDVCRHPEGGFDIEHDYYLLRSSQGNVFDMIIGAPAKVAVLCVGQWKRETAMYKDCDT